MIIFHGLNCLSVPRDLRNPSRFHLATQSDIPCTPQISVLFKIWDPERNFIYAICSSIFNTNCTESQLIYTYQTIFRNRALCYHIYSILLRAMKLVLLILTFLTDLNIAPYIFKLLNRCS